MKKKKTEDFLKDKPKRIASITNSIVLLKDVKDDNDAVGGRVSLKD